MIDYMKKLFFIICVLFISWCSFNIKEPKNDISEELTDQIDFIDNDISITNLWCLWRHDLADYVWFYQKFWAYFDDVYWNELIYNDCDKDSWSWYKINIEDVQILFYWLTNLSIESWQIVITWVPNWRDTYHIIRYQDDDNYFNKIVKKQRFSVNNKEYCVWNNILQYNIWKSQMYWFPEFWYNLNVLMNIESLNVASIMNVYKNKCQINVGLIFKRPQDSCFYVITKNDEVLEFISEDSDYMVPFSIDILD